MPSVAAKLQKTLKTQLVQMTDLTLKAINIHVVGLVFPDDEDAEEFETTELFPKSEQE